MLALIRKDLRLLRPVLWTAAALAALWLVLLPAADLVLLRFGYADSYVQHAWSHPQGRPPPPDYARQAASVIEDGAPFAVLAALVATVAVASVAFARERRERWAEFLAMLPVPRGRAVGLKLAASVAVCVLMLVGVAAVLGAVERFLFPGRQVLPDNGSPDPVSRAFAAVGLAKMAVALSLPAALFGGAWVLSSVLRSVALAGTLALGIVAGTYFWCAINLTPATAFVPNGHQAFVAIETPGQYWAEAAVGAAAGAAAVVAGVVVQTRRTSP